MGVLVRLAVELELHFGVGYAVSAWPASRSICWRRICRGAGTSAPLASSTGSASSSAVPGCHGIRAGGQFGPHRELAVAGLQQVALHGVRVDVHGQQVVARVAAVRQHLVDEVPAVEALALQPPLHVDRGHDHCVDAAAVHLGDQLLRRQRRANGRARTSIGLFPDEGVERFGASMAG